jgi:hypothetical protein
MSRSNDTEAQMIGALKQLEAGRKAEDVAREVGGVIGDRRGDVSIGLDLLDICIPNHRP